MRFRNEPLLIYWNRPDLTPEPNVEILVDIVDNYRPEFPKYLSNSRKRNDKSNRSIELLIINKHYSNLKGQQKVNILSHDSNVASLYNGFKMITTNGNDVTTMQFTYQPIYDEIPLFGFGILLFFCCFTIENLDLI